MICTIVSGYRGRLAGHLAGAMRRIDEDGYYRLSTITPSGLPSDLVFEVDPAMVEDRDTHLVVRHIDDLMTGRPEIWVPGESLRRGDWT